MKSVKKILNYLLLATLVSGSYLGFAKAAITWPNTGLNIPIIANTVINWFFGLAGVLFLIMFVYGGIKYMTSAGNEESSQEAKKLLLNAVIGLVVIGVAYAVSTYVTTIIGAQYNFQI